LATLSRIGGHLSQHSFREPSRKTIPKTTLAKLSGREGNLPNSIMMELSGRRANVPKLALDNQVREGVTSLTHDPTVLERSHPPNLAMVVST